MVKFPDTSDLKGYGFDVAADRVVRFNKHPDGTYLNTRATYSINGKQYTHYDIRNRSMNSQSAHPPANKIKRWAVIAVFAMLIAILTDCSVNFSVNSTITQEGTHERTN